MKIKIKKAAILTAFSLFVVSLANPASSTEAGDAEKRFRESLNAHSNLVAAKRHETGRAEAAQTVILKAQVGQFDDIPSYDLELIQNFRLDLESIRNAMEPFFLNIEANRGNADEPISSASNLMLARTAEQREKGRQIEKFLKSLSVEAQQVIETAVQDEFRHATVTEIDFRALAKEHPETVTGWIRSAQEKFMNIDISNVTLRTVMPIENTAAPEHTAIIQQQ